MFAGIAGRYDIANRVLSLGIDRGWRRRLIQKVSDLNPRNVVDLATGSGDVALEMRQALAPSTEIRGMDFCEPMLVKARDKAFELGFQDSVSFEMGDCLSLPLDDDSVDVLTISFGLRNLEDRQRGLSEILRVLNPEKGTLLVLEFTQPDAWFRPIYYLYLKLLLPILSGVLTGRPRAYRYLGCSIAAFPDKQNLAEEMLNAGFKRVGYRGMTASVVAIHEASLSLD